ncbi:DegT/DnrJ/EryC1/StrS family aminotransferase [Marinobacter sp. chi1]|uniref:DegT/DnrJ/EryC1/StrS family aminotransferase n=1 Tax=Marinobacter suaedae TaxID=3057675 RepID=A0ABT8W2D6_9GAMM|nr:DegT/DnrJ/EryC1/StrS family aminotransferase [Marinobacter sp. chi1]MDO3722405.1 DegT/DnrJ/EryC1/StrS family aminotransferase [Marinobacter sp. chi1]
MMSKVRPVGSRVPRPEPVPSNFRYPWAINGYLTEFLENGTQALSLSIAIAIAKKRDISAPEVILPAYGCPDLVAAVVAQGAKPVLVDLLSNTAQMDDNRLCHAIGPGCVAVVAVGFLGVPERLKVLSEICREREIFLIEDSAQCFPPSGITFSHADAIVLSFGRGKPINLMGGGALIYQRKLQPLVKEALGNTPSLAKSVGILWRFKRLVFNWLMMRLPYWAVEKVPFLHIGQTRYQECPYIRRAILSDTLLFAGIQYFFQRPYLGDLYRKELDELCDNGWRLLGSDCKRMDHPGCSVPRVRIALLAPSSTAREHAELALNRAGIGATNFYGAILPELEGLEGFFESAHFPVAKDFSSRLLTLPCHEDVRPGDIHKIVKIMKKLYSDDWASEADRVS